MTILYKYKINLGSKHGDNKSFVNLHPLNALLRSRSGIWSNSTFPTMLSEGRAGFSEGGWDLSVYPLVRALVLPEISQAALLGSWRCCQRFDVPLWK